ncbi:ABC transporter ATP-binding protein [Schleiferilactobacillus harbinensis]|uniref:ATP-binding cassette domain-containing protein n=1 Tax=Schleiferilactobacillus harbinensis TaxID=304207 RepID=UPI0021A8CFBC|nr:ABC transporter ATP-binding protein [Schleiferilactobacillus harbinensis]MCT2908763.1 ABC transporter ATP-binding protein [Schleiferilactobacillus harbinensis]
MTVTLTNLTKRIGRKEVVTDISFTWRPGEITGLVGRNGAGKTTLFRTMMLQYIPDSGTIQINDQTVTPNTNFTQSIFFVDSQDNFFGNSPLAEIASWFTLVYPQFSLDSFWQEIDHFKIPRESRWSGLSKGMQATILMALALASNVPYIILDEPFSGLDVIAREQVTQMIIDAAAEHHTAFLISSHDLEELDGISDRVLILKDHHILHDYMLEELREEAKKIQVVFRHNKVPAAIKKEGTLIRVTGQVLEIVFLHYDETIEKALQDAQPVFMEDLPLTLTDIFRTTAVHDTDYLLGKEVYEK